MNDSATQGITTVLCPVSDLETAKTVYAALLGAAPIADSEYYVGFEAAGPAHRAAARRRTAGPDSADALLAGSGHRGEARRGDRRRRHRQGARPRRRRRPPGGRRNRPRRQRPRADAGPVGASTLHQRSRHDLHRIGHPRGGRPHRRQRFYTAAFGLGTELGLRASEAPTSGFRGFTLSLVVSQPANVDALIGAAVDAGATTLKPVKKSLGLRRCRTGPGRDDLEGRDVVEEEHRPGDAAGRRDRAPAGGRGRSREQAVLRRPRPRGGKELRPQVRRVRHAVDPVKLALYGRRALAKDAGVSPEGSGSHRIVIGSDAGPFTDPDGFAWEPAREAAGGRASAAVTGRAGEVPGLGSGPVMALAPAGGPGAIV